jgi:ATP-dependent Lon protease
LRGKVLPVGGIKEKVLAARRAGIKTIILPRRNESDLEDIPPEVRSELETFFVDTVDEVLGHALRDGKAEQKSAGPVADKGLGQTDGKGEQPATAAQRPRAARPPLN